MIYHIISKCRKLVPKESKIGHGWVHNVFNRKFCKKVKFDYTNKWCMQNPKSVLENEMEKIFDDIVIETDYLLPIKRPGIVIIKKKKNRPS